MRLYAAGRAGTLRHTARNEDGTALDATGSVSVTIVDDAGATVQTGTATDVGVGEYSLALNSTVRTTLGQYTATWAYTLSGSAVTVEQPFEVVADFLFDVADLRAHDEALEDDVRYPADKIRDARDAATERIENSAQVAFAQRATRQILHGSGRERLLLPHTDVVELHEVWINGVQADETDVDVLPEGVLVYAGGWDAGINNVEVRYVHGYAAIPNPIRTAAMILAVEYLIPSPLPARATAQSTDLGEFRISSANVDAGRDTGIPEVDAVIARFGRRRPVLR